MKLLALAFAVAVALAISQARAADPPLIVHEWGTFTCLQDETGRAIGGINTDDEPVPSFVHRALAVNVSNALNLFNAKYIPYIENPKVTMRLETPVIYFHRPPGSPVEMVGVDVAFHGGWLSEFYPNAKVAAPGLSRADRSMLSDQTVGTLDWPEVRIGIGGTPPTTTDKVWTTPRAAQSDPITVGSESERFLFYRGVGHIDSPLRVWRLGTSDKLMLYISGLTHGQKIERAEAAALAHSPMWLVRVDADGHVDWKRGYSEPEGGKRTLSMLGEMDSSFDKDAIHSTGLASLHKDMAAYLVKAGLFPDEAEAMLNTWQVSYFKSPGLRLFFLVPRSWTDRTLPLHITGNPPITRVMVGRIEIVTPQMRSLIRQIESAPGPQTEPANVANAVEERIAAGEPLADAVKGLSPAARAYVMLGRFRDALLIDQQRQHPNDALLAFMQHHGVIIP